MRLVPAMVTFEILGPPAQNIDVHLGMCPSLHKWINSKFTSRKKIAIDIKEREGLWRSAFEVKHIGKAPAEMQPLTVLCCEITYPSGCCKAFFIALICWKWQDISVANTISMTRALNSLLDSITIRAARKEKHKNQHQTHSSLLLSANYWQQYFCM